MSIYKRGQIWWVHVEVDGQVYRESARTKDKKKAKEVEAYVRNRLYDDFQQQQLGRAVNRTFSEALWRWLDGEATRLKSYKNVKSKAKLIEKFLGNHYLVDIPEATAYMISEFLEKDLKPATINRRISLVKRVLNLAYDWGWLNQPIAAKIKKLPGEEPRHVYLNRDEILKLANASAEAKDAILYLSYTGLRISELFRLSEDNRKGNNLVIDANTKNGRPKVVPLPVIIRDIKLPLKITRDKLRTRFEAARTKCKLEHVRMHDLRHSYASLLIQANCGLTVVRDLLGHSSLAVTSRYSHLETKHLEDAVTNAFGGDEE